MIEHVEFGSVLGHNSVAIHGALTFKIGKESTKKFEGRQSIAQCPRSEEGQGFTDLSMNNIIIS